jgi:hypothetical protein
MWEKLLFVPVYIHLSLHILSLINLEISFQVFEDSQSVLNFSQYSPTPGFLCLVFCSVTLGMLNLYFKETRSIKKSLDKINYNLRLQDLNPIEFNYQKRMVETAAGVKQTLAATKLCVACVSGAAALQTGVSTFTGIDSTREVGAVIRNEQGLKDVARHFVNQEEHMRLRETYPGLYNKPHHTIDAVLKNYDLGIEDFHKGKVIDIPTYDYPNQDSTQVPCVKEIRSTVFSDIDPRFVDHKPKASLFKVLGAEEYDKIKLDSTNVQQPGIAWQIIYGKIK